MRSTHLLVLCAFTALIPASTRAQCVSLTSASAYTQDFNTLSSTASSTTNTLTINGWFLTESGDGARDNEQYGVDTGTSTTGDIYSYGAAGNSERALGALRSGALIPLFGACFTNNTGAAINSLTVSYTGEEWRLGAAGRTDQINFEYSTNATGLTTGAWIGVAALNFTTPNTVTLGAKDGNNASNRLLRGPQSIVTPIVNGATFWIRWTDTDPGGSDDGLAVDDFSLTPVLSGGSTNPAATGAATTAAAGSTTTFSGTITAGTNPASASYTVSCNLTSVGGSSTYALTVTGTSISGTYNVPPGQAPSLYSLPCVVTDDQARTGNFNISLTVSSSAFTCGGPKTLIGAIQGSGASSTMTGQVKEIEGVVIGAYQGAAKLNGFYVQDEGDGDPATSDGIFIDESGGSLLSVSAGRLVRIRATVAETFNQTVLNTLTNVSDCGTGSVAPTDVTFPVSPATYLERHEGMLVRFPQELRVTDNYDLGRFGEVRLAYVPTYTNGVTHTRLMVGTQVAAPGAAALAVADLNARSRILLDDGSNQTYGNLAPSANWPQDGGGLAHTNAVRLGDRVNVTGNTYTPLVGVLGFGFSSYRLQPVPGSPIAFGPSDNPRPAAAPGVGGRVKVASANVLNYFTTYTTVDSNARGADNQAEFMRQRDKVIAAFRAMDAAVIAIGELENNPSVSIEDLVNDSVNAFGNSLNTGNPGKWAYVDTGIVGTDAIRVGFIYQPALAQPVGVFKVLDSAVDPRALSTRNRPAIAQTFKLLSGGKPALQHFTVVANHFKSKGSSCTSAPNDPDTNDGQDNCNLSRVSMAQALLDWLATNPTADPTVAADRKVLIVGDLNAYLKEDPILALTKTTFSKPATAGFPAGFPANTKAVFTDLVSGIGDAAGYSYLFSGESGALDHALANPALFRLITGVAEWHINADEPVVFDYNSDYDGNSTHNQQKSGTQLTAWYNGGAFRTSDHDPLLVGFNPLCGDLDDDGDVDAADQVLMREAIGKKASTVDRRMDFDRDGRITLTDFSRWSACAATYQR